MASSSERNGTLLYLMGVSQFVPLVAGWEGREFLLLYLIFWLPAAAVLWLRSENLTILKPLYRDRLFRIIALWFAWGVISGGIAFFAGLLSGDRFSTVRLMSVGALVMYGVLPLLGGVFVAQGSLTKYVQGVATGLLGSCAALVVIYLVEYALDPDYIRLAIGQRIPAVLLFSIPILLLTPVRTFAFRLVLLFALTLVIWLSMTRAAILGWVVGSAATMLFLSRKDRWQAGGAAIVMALAIFCSTQVGFLGGRLGIVVSLENGSASKGLGIASVEIVEDSAATRLLIWREAIRVASVSPSALLFGHGQLGAPHLLPPINSASGSTISAYSAHSEYFDQLLRGGAVGLLLVLAVNLELIRRGWQSRRWKGGFEGFQLALGISTLAVGAYGVFHETTRYPWLGVVFWTTVGICLGRQVSRQHSGRDSKSA